MSKPPELTSLEALQLLLDQVDYTNNACGVTELVGAVLDADVIKICRATISREKMLRA